MGEHHSRAGQAASEVRRAGSGFVAGFLATLIFHQAMLAVLHLMGLTERTPFVTEPVPPLGVPAVVSLGFWGGLWGVVFACCAPWRRSVNYWLFAALFGAIVPTLANWFIFAPLHGRSLGGGWHGAEMLTSVSVNVAWGLGTALFFRALFRGRLETFR